jgi:hypothetical protein
MYMYGDIQRVVLVRLIDAGALGRGGAEGKVGHQSSTCPALSLLRGICVGDECFAYLGEAYRQPQLSQLHIC